MNSAALVRSGAELDEEHREQIAEELEWMAKNDRRERNSRTTTLMTHLLKIKYQPGKLSPSWTTTVNMQRDELNDLLEQSPSLKTGFSEELLKLYARARKRAKDETDLDTLPDQNPFSLDQLLNG